MIFWGLWHWACTKYQKFVNWVLDDDDDGWV